MFANKKKPCMTCDIPLRYYEKGHILDYDYKKLEYNNKNIIGNNLT